MILHVWQMSDGTVFFSTTATQPVYLSGGKYLGEVRVTLTNRALSRYTLQEG